MNKTLIFIVVIIVLVFAGFMIFNQRSADLIMPEIDFTEQENGDAEGANVDSGMAVPTENGDAVDEMIVENDTNGVIESDETSNGTSTDPDTQGPAVKEFSVDGRDFNFSRSEIIVSQGDTVRIVFRNAGQMPHDFVLDEFAGARTAIINSGQQQTIEFVADKAGTFEYYCSVGSHRQMGMVGNFIVE